MKYSSDLCHITNCPPQSSVSVQRQAYRFVFEPICEKSFIPQGKKSPQRISKENKNTAKCSLLGLSMFSDEESAKQRFIQLKKFCKNIDKTIGTHLAAGIIKPDHGVSTSPDQNNHFDLFEFSGVDLTKDFTMIHKF